MAALLPPFTGYAIGRRDLHVNGGEI